MSGLQSKESIRFPISVDEQELVSLEFERESQFVHNRHVKGEELKSFPLSRRAEMIEEFDRDLSFENCEQKEHSNLDNWIPTVDELIRIDDLRGAHTVLRRVFSRDPYNVVAMELLAICFAKDSKNDKAIQVRLEMERLGDQEFHNLSQLGHLYYRMDEDIRSEYYYEEAILRRPSAERALFELEKNWGNIRLRAGDIQACEEHYNRAYALNPDSDVLLVNYGTLEIQKGEYAKALKRFRRAVDLNSFNDKAWMGLGLIHRQYGDIELSWGNIEKSLDINPGNETAIQLMMDWGMKDNLLERCISRLDSYLELYPENTELTLVLAKLFYCTNRMMQAKFEVDKVLSYEPNYKDAIDLNQMIEKYLVSVQESVCE